jgi:hypothetical protein
VEPLAPVEDLPVMQAQLRAALLTLATSALALDELGTHGKAEKMADIQVLVGAPTRQTVSASFNCP